jgi:alpha-amylase/alpha-mannosidase (GH57 family)
MSTRYLCIHGHFYQPPRENPWLEAIEVQDSAYPYHDWNERITRECYAPNAASRILDAEGRIERIVSNYARISFNFGPTLLAWLEAEAPEVYAAVLEADRVSAERFSGHGSALAQAYNHMIMPLANERDRRTQTLWGVRDFEHRFGRAPEGMWLPETAAGTSSLEALAEAGIRFTILAPRQARRVRPLGAERWEDVQGGRIDPTRAYRIRLPSGRHLDAFFYDGGVSQAVAFEGLLGSGERFADRLLSGFSEERDWPQLMHIATDGETYGHHHRHGDMALAYALEHIDRRDDVSLTNYGEYLERHPPAYEAELIEDSSWSCYHGVERWRADCGCQTGMNPGWTQSWRAPLRAALDWLRDALEEPYAREAGALLDDPWAARDEYVGVILDRSPASVEAFFARHGQGGLSEAETTRAIELLELERQAMLMYTSCGWFFDELSGIETVQVLQYAGRALQLAESLFGEPLEERFMKRLAAAPSNVPLYGDGRGVYDRLVRPAAVDLPKVAAHHTMTLLVTREPDPGHVYCYRAERLAHRELHLGRASLAVGQLRVTSDITRESAHLDYGVLHLGDHNLYGGVRPHRGATAYARLVEGLEAAHAGAEFAGAVHWLDDAFRSRRYSLSSLFRDEQRAIIRLILGSTLAETEAAHRQVFEHHASLMRYLADLGAPIPKSLRATAEIVLNTELRHAFEAGVPDPDEVRQLFEGTATWRLELDVPGLAFALDRALESLGAALAEAPEDGDRLERLDGLVELAHGLPFEVDLWKTQNAFYALLSQAYPHRRAEAANGDDEAAAWVRAFERLGARLRVRVEAPAADAARAGT